MINYRATRNETYPKLPPSFFRSIDDGDQVTLVEEDSGKKLFDLTLVQFSEIPRVPKSTIVVASSQDGRKFSYKTKR